MSAAKPFHCQIAESVLEDLQSRLAETRWPDALPDQGWRLGTEPAFLERVCAYWRRDFDWRSAEARLNRFDQFLAEVNGTTLHYVHARSGRENVTPFLLTNGWPSSIFEYLQLIPLLTAAGFDVVAPALPGYGFSERPRAPGMNPSRIAGLFSELMKSLGYKRFLAHGSDIGAGVVEQMRRKYPDMLLGVHFSNVYWGYPQPDDPTPEERKYFEAVRGWQFSEGAYAMLQGTKPQTLAYGLNDSPTGLAGWILEKFQAWCDGAAEQVFGLDGLCSNLTLYWATETIGSSCRLYAEAFADRAGQENPERGPVPAGVIVFPRDILPAPRAWGERWLNLVHWTEAARGGHFPAWETPNLLAQDLVNFAEQAGT